MRQLRGRSPRVRPAGTFPLVGQRLLGDRVLRDQVDIGPDEFYRRLETEPDHPTTSQPPPRELVEALERIAGELETRVPAGVSVRLGLIEVGHGAPLDRVEAALRDRYDVVDCVRGAPTGVVGSHNGSGAWGVVYQVVSGDDPLSGVARRR